jgi:hypothetical protein
VLGKGKIEFSVIIPLIRSEAGDEVSSVMYTSASCEVECRGGGIGGGRCGEVRVLVSCRVGGWFVVSEGDGDVARRRKHLMPHQGYGDEELTNDARHDRD